MGTVHQHHDGLHVDVDRVMSQVFLGLKIDFKITDEGWLDLLQCHIGHMVVESQEIVHMLVH